MIIMFIYNYNCLLTSYCKYNLSLSRSGFRINLAGKLIVTNPKTTSTRSFIFTSSKAPFVVRTTSPLDHRSVWYEIFPKTVGKSHAAQWICHHFGLDEATALAVGNDFNDLDMLRWANTARVVGNAPEPLSREFQSVADHSESGFSDAVAQWLADSA